VVAEDAASGFREVRSPVVLANTEPVDVRPAPRLDQHGEAIRRWLADN